MWGSQCKQNFVENNCTDTSSYKLTKLLMRLPGYSYGVETSREKKKELIMSMQQLIKHRIESVDFVVAEMRQLIT